MVRDNEQILDEVRECISELVKNQAVTANDIKYIRKEIEGNGKKGLITKVEDLETYRDKAKGTIDFIKWLVGFVGVGNIIILLKLFF